MTSPDKSRILILDDDPMVLSALERLLRHEFELVLVESIELAQSVIRRHRFELALVDLHLNSGTSLDFFRELSLVSPTTVRILISGALNLNSLLDSLSSSLIHKVLQKPWEPATLIVQIREARQLHLLLKEKIHLEELSTTDAKTGLYNDRFLQSFLAAEMERSKRHSRPLSLIMIDVDGFKNWNDTRGHLAGDQVIHQIGQLIKESLRPFDCVCRYGGDEYCILLQETELATAFEIAERVRKKVQSQAPLTISLGVSSFPQTSPDFERILADADKALYVSKNQGRNRSSKAGI